MTEVSRLNTDKSPSPPPSPSSPPSQIVIMRGLPGSGKDSYIQNRFLVELRYNTIEVCCADDYHMVNSKYQFNPQKAGWVHDQCFKKYLEIARSIWIAEFDKVLVVNNTNTTLVELAPYVRVATALGIPYEIIYLMCSPSVSMSRNTHEVPNNTILQMHKNLVNEIVPPYWNQKVMVC